MIYLISYKYKKPIKNFKSLQQRIFNSLTCFFTRGKYSHCEIAIKRPNGSFDCYSSSVRDKGVRMKNQYLKPERWDFVELTHISEKQVEDYYQMTKQQKYDFLGALGLVLPFRDNTKKQFCSEWCFNAINCFWKKGIFVDKKEGWRFNPSQLQAIYNKKS